VAFPPDKLIMGFVWRARPEWRHGRAQPGPGKVGIGRSPAV